METKKEMSIEDLAKLMNAGFEKSAQQTDEKIENLARIVQDSLLKMDTGFKEVRTDIKELKDEVTELKATTDRIEGTIIQKADKIDLNTLDYRVEKLEEKYA